jgi:hypothetical protein
MLVGRNSPRENKFIQVRTAENEPEQWQFDACHVTKQTNKAKKTKQIHINSKICFI